MVKNYFIIEKKKILSSLISISFPGYKLMNLILVLNSNYLALKQIERFITRKESKGNSINFPLEIIK